MKHRSLLFLLLSLVATFVAACGTVDDAESTVPHNYPASWEGSGPGMPSVPGGPR